jgi:ATP-binding cassette subfamily F protein 3
MIVLTVEEIRKHFGPEPVLDGVTFTVNSGERIGLVGPNGTGKTTLLRIIAGKDDQDGGKCELHPSVSVGYLEQQPELIPGRTLWEEARSALDQLIAYQHEAEEVAHALAGTTDEAEHRRLAARYDFLQQELERHGAYNLDHKIERVLEGLGLRRDTFQLPVDSLSGGEQNRLMLAKLLLAEPDLMLLDEPSNHLDIQATEWLEAFLGQTQAAMILVSHDRYFLDKVTTHTLELFHGTVDRYTGNFSAYWQQKADRLLVQRRTYEKQVEEIEKTKEFIRKNFYGQKHTQAEDRKKKLVRLEEDLVAPPREIAAPPMGFPEVSRSGDLVLRAQDLAKTYDQRTLFEDVSLDIMRGQRWGILGPNGCGKTTLLRCLLGQLEADAGQVMLGQGVKVGYFDQHLSSVADDTQVVDAVRPDHKEFNEQRRRDLLARFGLTGDTALQQVNKLSGGERCRAALARLAAADANLLVLDEPTNHLDLWARDALERSLRNFDGTVLFVSHDRYFVNQVADHLIVVEPGRFRVLEGNYAAYLQWVESGFIQPGADAGKAKPAAKTSSKPAAKPSSKPSRDGAAGTPARAKRRFPYRKVEDIEQEILDRETRIEEFHLLLATPETLRDGERVRQLKAQLAAEQETLEQLYAHWEEAVELNW